ncbi:hypothetical protein FWK35_00020911 [Aphis craccivora]|uniref:Uncharacterized protein n=1 Tax=Aphis craccivora TaxID=307492 RepID=A0A6G0Z0C0_APHCR|nr:hypothetical protein FWK35_00020911 [Aphis craccivora]
MIQTCPLGSRDQVVENVINSININNLRLRLCRSCLIEVCCRDIMLLPWSVLALKNFLSLPFHQLLAHNTCFNTYNNDPLPFDFLQKRRKVHSFFLHLLTIIT